jgi:uncharacterized membrane protein YccC
MAGSPVNISQYKWYRKETYVALANVSDAFQRMLNEPKKRQEQGAYLHPLIVGCHVLASRSAALGRIGLTLQLSGSQALIAAYKTMVKNKLDNTIKLILQEAGENEYSAVADAQNSKRLMEEMHIAWKDNPAFKDSGINPNLLISFVEGIAALSNELKRLAQKPGGVDI